MFGRVNIFIMNVVVIIVVNPLSAYTVFLYILLSCFLLSLQASYLSFSSQFSSLFSSLLSCISYFSSFLFFSIQDGIKDNGGQTNLREVIIHCNGSHFTLLTPPPRSTRLPTSEFSVSPA
jgi:hypothetical protein